jgi:hypothetical protein
MPSLTRRRALQSAVGALGLLAGCSGQTSTTRTVTPAANGPPDRARTDVESVRLRNPANDLVVTRGDATPTTESGARLWEHLFVTDAKTADSLAFADVEGVEAAREFLAATDFDAETVYVEQRGIGACYRQELCWVSWTKSSIRTSYARRLRDADEACDADEQEVAAELIRLPVVLDPDEIRERGSEGGPGNCRAPGREGNA